MREWSIRPNTAVPYEIRWADDDLLIVDKPAGVVSQPGRGHPHDSLLNGLFARYAAALQNLGEARDWGLLHRLDKETSGLLVVALRVASYEALRRDFEHRRVKKLYWALVAGLPSRRQGVIQRPIAEVAGARKRAVLRRHAAPAVTAYRVLQSAGRASLVEARPATGRLHQIRVHLASIGCPVLGDDMYGSPGPPLRVPRLCLHAARLAFAHPDGSRRVAVRAPWPADLRATLARLGLSEPE